MTVSSTTSVSPFPMSCHLITWGEDLTTAVREASGLGFRACETFTHLALAYEDDPPRLADLLGEHGLRLSALYAGGRFSDPDRADETIASIERVARFLSTLGVDRIVFGPGGPRSAPTTADGLRTMAATINEAAKRTADLGVHACVHPHLGTELQDRNELDAIMETTNPDIVGFCPDTAHLAGAGMDPIEVIHTYGDRIGYAHLKDLRPRDSAASDTASSDAETGTAALPIFCELGQGVIDLPGAIEALRAVGYSGWLTVEIDRPSTTPLESLTVCRDYLVSELGLDVGTVGR